MNEQDFTTTIALEEEENNIKTISSSKKHLVFLESCFNEGQRRMGVEKGPRMLFESNKFKQAMNNRNYEIITVPTSIAKENKEEEDNNEEIKVQQTLISLMKDEKEEKQKEIRDLEDICHNQESVGLFAKNLHFTYSTIFSNLKKEEQELKEVTEKQNFPFIINVGGDHSVAIGSIYSMLSLFPDLRVLWIDAHADINTPEGSLSKNMHGMPVAFLSGEQVLGKERCDFKGFEWMNNQFKLDVSSRLAYIGLRDVDDFEQKIIEKYNIKAFTAHDVAKVGIEKCLEDCFNYLGLLKNNNSSQPPLFLSFDVDAVDPRFTPSTGTAVENGITHEDALKICKKCRDYVNFVGMDLVEVNPSIGSDKEVAETISHSVDYLIQATENL
ncbi:hypothetical protein ABK040_000710 [Willaertia magna]